MISGEYRVEEWEAGMRLDAFLLERCPSSTRAFVRVAIQSGNVSVCGRKAIKGAKLRTGDEISVCDLLEKSDNKVRPDASVIPDIVYEDEYLIGVNKPAGISVQPLSPTETGTLMNGLVAKYPFLADVGDEPLIAGAVHRIDGGTSGLVIVAKDQATFDAMRKIFSERKVEKHYRALVEGRVTKQGRVSCFLCHDPHLSYCKMIDSKTCKEARESLLAETYYSPIHGSGRNTLLDVSIRTGITHQIRAQLAIAGYPIVGDTLYGAKPQNNREGFCLHSYSATFIHPATKEHITITAENIV